MLTLIRNFSPLTCVSLILLLGCNNSSFRGGSEANKSKTVEEPKPVIDPNAEQPKSPDVVKVKDEIQCKEKTDFSGMDVIVLVDNSSSNATTDCPGRTSLGLKRNGGYEVFSCSSQTQREQAIIESFKHLVSISSSTNDLTESRMAVVSFPTSQDIDNGSKLETNGWLDVKSNKQNSLGNSLSFARKPDGMTPYGAGLYRARNLLAGEGNNNRKKLVLLVTDGEPTDKAPNNVRAYAEQLKQNYGAVIGTVLVTSGANRTTRLAEHKKYLSNRGYDEAVISNLSTLVDGVSDEVWEVKNVSSVQAQMKEMIDKVAYCKI